MFLFNHLKENSYIFFFFSSRRRHTRSLCDWSSDVCSSDLAPGKQELDPRILQDATVVLDDMAQAMESGEVNVPLHAGLFTREQIFGTLGEIVAGKKPGRIGRASCRERG